MYCSDCKYSNIVGYEYDDGYRDEYPIFKCLKNCNEVDDFGDGCQYYEEYIPQPYIEQNSKCDKCRNLGTCIDNGTVINCATSQDSRQHYFYGLDSTCKLGDMTNITPARKDMVIDYGKSENQN